MENRTSAPERVLVVEDHPEIAQLLELVLQSEGYTVWRMEDAAQALEIAHSQRPDLILLDVILPNGDGFELAEQLQRTAETADIPIIFLTARSEIESVIRGLELGVDYITKPFALPELAARVGAALRQRRRYRLASAD